MRSKIKITPTLATLLVFAAAPLASAQVGKAPDAKDNKMVKLLPDLVVGVVVKREEGKAIVTVANKCKGKAAQSTVSIFFYKDEQKKHTEYVVMNTSVPPLAPGAQKTLTIESGYIKGYPFLRAVIDITNKIKEASEGNNWWEMNAQPFPDKGGYCDPPYGK